MSRVILDIDTLSELIKRKNRAVARRGADYLRSYQQLTISSISVMEIVTGLRKTDRPTWLEFKRELPAFEVLTFGEPEAELAGRLIAELDLAGRPIGTADPAIALTHDLELITGNVRHFSYIQQIGHPLKVQSWHA